MVVLRLPDSWSNWNLEMLVFEEVDDFLAFYLFCTALLELPPLVGNLSFTCLFCLCTFHAQFHSAIIGQNLTALEDGESHGALEVEFKFLRRDCKLSLLGEGGGGTPLYKL